MANNAQGDFWKELEEELKEEGYWALWHRYQVLIFSIMSLVIMGAAAWHVWQRAEEKRAEYSASLYYRAMNSGQEKTWQTLRSQSWAGWRLWSYLNPLMDKAEATIKSRQLDQWRSLKKEANHLSLACRRHHPEVVGWITLVLGYTALQLFVEDEDVWPQVQHLAEHHQQGWDALALELMLLRAYQKGERETFEKYMDIAKKIPVDSALKARLRLLGIAMGIPFSPQEGMNE